MLWLFETTKSDILRYFKIWTKLKTKIHLTDEIDFFDAGKDDPDDGAVMMDCYNPLNSNVYLNHFNNVEIRKKYDTNENKSVSN